MRFPTQALVVATLVGAAAAGGSAFTAGNTTTPQVSVGQAATATAGFAVSGVRYTLGTDDDKVVEVDLALTRASGSLPADEVKLRLVTGAAYYTSCTLGAPADLTATPLEQSVHCALSPALAASAITTLDVVAISNSSSPSSTH